MKDAIGGSKTLEALDVPVEFARDSEELPDNAHYSAIILARNGPVEWSTDVQTQVDSLRAKTHWVVCLLGASDSPMIQNAYAAGLTIV